MYTRPHILKLLNYFEFDKKFSLIISMKICQFMIIKSSWSIISPKEKRQYPA
jgi:hypothetical protein